MKKEKEVIKMEDLVALHDQQAVTTSLKVSEVFGKRHDNVLRDINNLKKDALNFEEMFVEGDSPDSYGRSRKVFFMNKDGFSLLAMGFTGKKAIQFKLKFIEQFNLMERTIKGQFPHSYEDAIILLANEISKRKEIEYEARSAISYVEHYSGAEGSLTVTQIAKSYGMSAIALNRILRDVGVQYRCNNQWVLYQKYAGKGYTTSYSHVLDFTNQQDTVILTTRWTPAGQAFIHRILIDNDYIDVTNVQ